MCIRDLGGAHVLLLVSAISAAVAGPVRSHALLMGVQAEAGVGARLAVQTDVQRIGDALQSRAWSSVVRRPDTRDPVAELRSLYADVSVGDTVLVHVSGHGTRVDDDDGDEPDGLDEALQLPGGGLLRDDTWALALTDLAAHLGPDGLLVVSHDTCHGGGLTRGLSHTPRGHGPVPDGADGVGSDLARARGAAAPVVHLAAARPSETARELAGGGGAYSQALADALVAGAPNWSTVHRLVQDQLARSAPGQHPLLSGPGDRLVGGAAGGKPGVAVDAVLADGRVRVVGGRLLGLAVGDAVRLASVDGVFAAGSVVEVTDSTSFLQVDGPRRDWHRAELEPSARAPVAVAMDGLGGPDLEPWRAALERAGAENRPGPWRVHRVGDIVRLDGPRGVVARAPLDQPPTDSGVVRAVRARVASEHLGSLRLGAPGAVELVLFAADPETCAPGRPLDRTAHGELLLAPGEVVTARVQNHTASPLSMQLVHWDAHGTAAVLAAGQPLEPLAPGAAWTLPVCWRTVPPFGTERIKLFATRTPVPLSPWLEGRALRSPDWTLDGRTATVTYSVVPVLADSVVVR